MTTERAPYVSVTNPIGPAITWTKHILFCPFNLEKWLAIGFCAWLAFLGKGGGFNINYNVDGSGYHIDGSEIVQKLEEAKYFFLENMYWIIPVAVAVMIFIVGITLVLLYFSSRGRFMFLHCVAKGVAQIGYPWTQYQRQAHSLFGFRIVLALIGLLSALVILIDILFIIFLASGWEMRLIGIAVLPILMTLSIILFIIQKFTHDFVVPIMYLRNTGCIQAWNEFSAVLSLNKARFFLYLLFQIVIAIAVGVITLTVFILSCCLLCCVGCIPLLGQYIITVILLPLSVFKRSYSLYYLSQFSPDYHMIGTPPPPPTVTYPYIDPYASPPGPGTEPSA